MGKVFQFVQDFRESGELVTVEGFVKYFLAIGRVIDAVDVFVGVGVEVVVLEEEVVAKNEAYVIVTSTADVHAAAPVVSDVKLLSDLHYHAISALNVSFQMDGTPVLRRTKKECIAKTCNERMLAQSAVVNVPVVVPRVPVVGVVSIRNCSTS